MTRDTVRDPKRAPGAPDGAPDAPLGCNPQDAPDLQKIIDAWPGLSGAERRVIVAIVTGLKSTRGRRP